MKKVGLYVVTPIISFLGGFYVFVEAWKFFLQEEMSSNDFYSILFWGGMPYLILGVPYYLLIIYLVDKKIKRLKLLLYPLGCMLGFLLPVSPILSIWGGGQLFSPELMLFYGFFMTSGLIFGVLNWLFKNFLSDKNNLESP